MRADIYQSLYAINQSLETAAEHLEKLKVAEIMLPGIADVRRIAIEELRSEICAGLTVAIHSIEMKEARRLERERNARQKILNE
jgi:hypothetical protein